LCICIVVRDPGDGWDLIDRFNPDTLCACSKTGTGFPTLYVVVFYVFSELRWEVAVGFVDISGNVDHHCLIFLFIMKEVFTCKQTNHSHVIELEWRFYGLHYELVNVTDDHEYETCYQIYGMGSDNTTNTFSGAVTAYLFGELMPRRLVLGFTSMNITILPSDFKSSLFAAYICLSNFYRDDAPPYLFLLEVCFHGQLYIYIFHSWCVFFLDLFAQYSKLFLSILHWYSKHFPVLLNITKIILVHRERW